MFRDDYLMRQIEGLGVVLAKLLRPDSRSEGGDPAEEAGEAAPEGDGVKGEVPPSYELLPGGWWKGPGS